MLPPHPALIPDISSIIILRTAPNVNDENSPQKQILPYAVRYLIYPLDFCGPVWYTGNIPKGMEVIIMDRRFDVLSVGDVNMEIIFSGLRSMPILGRELLADQVLHNLGGSTVNTAVGIARQGMRSAFIGKIGRDEDGAFLLRELENFGVDTSMMRYDDTVSTGITVSLACGGDRAMVTQMGAIATLSADEIDDSMLESARHLHVGSFFLQTALRPGLADLFDRAHRLGLTTSLDIGWDDTGCWDYGIRNVLSRTDIIFPNESEATALTGCTDVTDAAAVLGKICPVAVVKNGGKGGCLYAAGRTLQLPAYPGEPIDTTGAGDAFNAGFLGAFLRRGSLEDCLRHGLASGSISVTRPGSAVSCPTLPEIEAMIRIGR